jgi:hypothetical protein
MSNNIIMKQFIFYLNIITLVVTFIAYAFNKGAGLQAQFILGVFQLIVAAAYTIMVFTTGLKLKLLLLYYWLLVIGFFILLRILPDAQDITFIIFPLCIATYFVYITYLIQKKS